MVVLTGSLLSIEELAAVARKGTKVQLDPGTAQRMARSRGVVQGALTTDVPVYGLTTGVASLKRVAVEKPVVSRFNQALVREHRIAQGPTAPPDVARAAMLLLANQFASGVAGVRPLLAERLVACLNDGTIPAIRLLGSVGMSDLGPNADLSAALFDRVDLEAGEGLALLNHSAVSTGLSALAVVDLGHLLDVADAVAALSLEGFGANLTILHPAVAKTRPYPGLAQAIERLRSLLDGSYLWQAGAARNLQDPLTFRGIPQVHGALRDALTYARAQLAVELNASQGNPLVVADEDRIISAANFDILPLASAVDFLRIALSPVLTSSAERTTKLLESAWSGMESGLSSAKTPEPGLGELDVAAAALAAEARLLAQPVSVEVSTTSIADGIEDRMTLAPLAARRLREMVSLGERVVAIELLVAAQAAELRGRAPLGQGTSRLVQRLRKRVSLFRSAEDFPVDLEPVVDLVRDLQLTFRSDATPGKLSTRVQYRS
ncbi:MAG TPA: aromatic amino acid ammonia-lyase [Candidatus Dormibacteraeota bacterium]|nr:aromatic amino acid ammonia-lyase [Candidatus Dormibacteraeota bacterium]